MKKKVLYIVLGVTLAIGALSLYKAVVTVPNTFPVGQSFIINENESLYSVSERLEARNLVSSALLFRMWASYIHHDRLIQVGEYVFTTPLNLEGVVQKLLFQKPDKPLLSVTIPEGSTSSEVAQLIQKNIPSFSQESFDVEVSKNNADGRLFPSTYYLLPSTTEERAVTILLNTFEEKYEQAFASLTLPKPLTGKHDVIVLASIIEGEAKTEQSMRMVSGILLARLQMGMPLQVDVARETYTSRGLPSQAINNPGLTAISAVFNPIASEYLYYITGNDGEMYYAKTFTEHKRNIQKYLK